MDDFTELFKKIEILLPNKFEEILLKNNMKIHNFEYRISDNGKPIFSADDVNTPFFDNDYLIIDTPGVFLRYLWGVCFYIQTGVNTYYINLDTQDNNKSIKKLSMSNLELATIFLSVANKYKTEYFAWPSYLLHPTSDFEDQDYLEYLSFLFFNAILFFYGHEYMHGWFKHFDQLVKLSVEIGHKREILEKFKIAQEVDADSKSIELLLGDSNDLFLAKSILISYCAIFLLIGNKTPKDHIDLFFRFDLVFDKVNLDDKSELWLIPAFIFVPDQELRKFSSSISILNEKETPKNIYKKMVNDYRKQYQN